MRVIHPESFVGIKCHICGVPALTVAPLVNGGGKMIGGCAKHADVVTQQMKRANTVSRNRRERKRQLKTEHDAKLERHGSRLPEHRKKTY